MSPLSANCPRGSLTTDALDVVAREPCHIGTKFRRPGRGAAAATGGERPLERRPERPGYCRGLPDDAP